VNKTIVILCWRLLWGCSVVLEEEEVVTYNRHFLFVVGLLVGKDVGGRVDVAPYTLYDACKVVVHSFQSIWFLSFVTCMHPKR
jgi:hypothetical protein